MVNSVYMFKMYIKDKKGIAKIESNRKHVIRKIIDEDLEKSNNFNHIQIKENQE